MVKEGYMDAGDLMKALLALLLGLLATLAENAWAEETAQLSLKPARCVAMNEGQTCYQTVAINWQADAIADYCLYQQGTEKPIFCWQQTAKGKTKVEFANSENLRYRLMMKLKADTWMEKAHAEMIVTWVYSKTKKRKNSWRLF